MIRTAYPAIAALLVACLGMSAARAEEAFSAQGTLQPLFAPWDNVETAVIDMIAGAHRQILVHAYLLTSKKIAASLIAAHRRGVDVQVLLDADQLASVASSAAPRLAAAGIAVWVETRYQSAHNKVVVVDADTPQAAVITGSFNFTWTAQHRNAENILIARDNPALAARYAGNWERHRQDATPYTK